MSPFGSVMVTPKDPMVDPITNTITFTCQSDAGPSLFYSWLFNGRQLPDNVMVNGTRLMIRNVTYHLGGTYTCVVMNIAGEDNDSSTLFGELCTYCK